MSKDKLPKIFLWACLTCAFLLASYVIFREYRFSLSTDGAGEDILAKLAVGEGRLIPTNWIYANGDLWILGPRLFLIILFPLLGLTYLLHASAIWLTYLYLLLVVYGTCRVVAPKQRLAAVIATTVAAGGISLFNFEFVIGQGAYALYAAMALAMFALVARERNLRTPWRARLLTQFLAAVAAALVCISNATRGDITVIIPLLLGWLAVELLFSSRPMRERIGRLKNPVVLSIIAGAVAGTLLYKFWLLPGVINSSGAASSQLAHPAEMLRHLSTLPYAWFTYFQVGGSWASLALVPRIVQCAVWVLSIALVLVPVWVVATPRRHAPSLITLAWFALACYGVTFAALVAAQELFAGYWSMRYATFGIYASVCVLAIWMDTLVVRHARISLTLAMLVCFIGIATIAAWRTEPTPGGVTYAERTALIESLEHRGVNRVLASYWNSEVLNVLSEDRITALPMQISASLGLNWFGQNSLRFVSYTSNERQAIALTLSEAPPAVWEKVKNEFGPPVQRYQSGPFEIWIYDRNIARLFYGHKAKIDVPVPAKQLAVRLSRTMFPACESSIPCTFTIEATNTGKHALISAGTKPIRLGIHGIGAQGRVIAWDDGRANFPRLLYPGATERVEISLRPSSNPEITGYQVCLLQERVAWLCSRTEVGSNGGASQAHPQATNRTSTQVAAIAAGRFHALLVLQGSPELTEDGKDILLHVLVTNNGKGAFGSRTPPAGVNLGAHSIDLSGRIVDNDLARAHLPLITPGASASSTIRLPVDKMLGERAEIIPVAEDMGWFDTWGTRPLIVGPFKKCTRGRGVTVCNAAGKPLHREPN